MRFKTPLGELSATGPLIVVLLAIAASSAALGSMVRDHDLQAAERAKMLNVGAKELAERVEELTYVLTLTGEEQRKLNLHMPESLRRKVRQ